MAKPKEFLKHINQPVKKSQRPPSDHDRAVESLIEKTTPLKRVVKVKIKF